MLNTILNQYRLNQLKLIQGQSFAEPDSYCLAIKLSSDKALTELKENLCVVKPYFNQTLQQVIETLAEKIQLLSGSFSQQLARASSSSFKAR